MMPVAGKLPVSGLYASNVMPSKRYSPSVVPTHKKPSSVCARELTNPLSPSLAVQAEWYICAIGPASSAPNTGIAGVRSAATHAIHRTVRSSHALPLMVASSPRCPYLRTRMHSKPADPARYSAGGGELRERQTALKSTSALSCRSATGSTSSANALRVAN